MTSLDRLGRADRFAVRGGTPAFVATLLAAAVFVLSACGSAAPAAPTQLSAEISVSQAAAMRDSGAFMLDVREPSEWQAGHIPDATLIPLGELQARLSEVPDDQTIVVVCRSGNRSAQGRDILRQAGYADATSMAGGMNDWTTAGYPVVTGP